MCTCPPYPLLRNDIDKGQQAVNYLWCLFFQSNLVNSVMQLNNQEYSYHDVDDIMELIYYTKHTLLLSNFPPLLFCNATLH